ncbi:MAG: phosphatidate cytidylyltransferase, partial [Actinobacteria bacterium]|nr:phosphatidate cytidylyltransferase [Actinomycetota bacterium]
MTQLPAPRRRDRDLPLAIASGLTLVVLLFGTLYLHPLAFVGLVLVLVVVGIAETGTVLRARGMPVAVPVVIVGGLVMIVGAYFWGHTGQALGLVVTFIGAAAWELADERRSKVVQRIATTLMLAVWVPLLASFAALLARGYRLSPTQPPRNGWVLVIATVGVAAISDVGAYAVGTKFGRRKMAPTISPGKT